jgi:hypothetical protein
VDRRPPDAGLTLERRMRKADVGSQCTDTIKLNFRTRCGRGSLDIAGATDVGLGSDSGIPNGRTDTGADKLGSLALSPLLLKARAPMGVIRPAKI